MIEKVCKNEASKEIAKIALSSTKETRSKDAEKIISMNWQDFQCCVDLTLKIRPFDLPDEDDSRCCGLFDSCNKSNCTKISKTSQFKVSFDMVHFLILAKKYKLLFHFLSQYGEKIQTRIDEMKPLPTEKVPIREHSWIFGANYLHMAAKYSPEALEILLEDSKQRFHDLIHMPSQRRQILPLHLAAMNQTNLASRLLLDHKAKPDDLDDRKYTPLFYAAAEGSIANLNLLLEKASDGGTLKELKGKNVLFKARSYETVMLLCKYGADPKAIRGTGVEEDVDKNETALKYLVKKNNLESPIAFLDHQLEEISDDMITMDFNILWDGDKKSPLDYHSHFRNHGRGDLILHPLMEIFLQIRWRQVQALAIFEFLMRFAFVLSLSYMAWRYMALTTCEYDKDDGANITGFTPEVGFTFRPRINNYIYLDDLNGTRTSTTHSKFHFPNGTVKEMPITCNADNLR